MRLFLFKLLFRFTWWIAPDSLRVNRIFDLYLEEIEKEEKFQECQRRQAEMDACIQPRTPTYEYLTVKQQREQYAAIMPPRIRESHQIRALYTDYDERNDS